MRNILVITGGSRGIGEKTIATFLENNWEVINLSRHNSLNNAVKNFTIDLTNPDRINEFSEPLIAAIKDADKISLVHNAASYKKNNIIDLSATELREDLEINLVAPVILNTLLIPHMKKSSSIIYIGSTLSEMAVANRASYTVSKHAIVGLMRATCQDLAGKDISTCCICPGFVNTTMVTNAAEADILAKVIKNKVTSNRLIEPNEIAEVIYFCANHPVMNGSVLHANLGQITT